MPTNTRHTFILSLFVLFALALTHCGNGCGGGTIEENNGIFSPSSGPLTVIEDTPKNINLIDFHEDLDVPLVYSISEIPTHGSITGEPPEIIYTPEENYTGPDSFSFIITAEIDDFDSFTKYIKLPFEKAVAISVLPINDSPSVSASETNIVLHDFLGKVCPLPAQTYEINLEGSDLEGDELSYSITVVPQNGTAEISDAILLYTPNTGFLGNDQVGVIANDGKEDSDTKMIDIRVATFESELPDSPTLNDYGFVFQAIEGTFTDFHGVNSPAVIYLPEEKKYVMYFETRFEGPLNDPNCTLPEDWGLGRAESTDLLNWELSPEPVITPGDHPDYACAAAHSAALYDGELFHLWFKMHPVDGSQEGLGYAISEDGFDFIYQGKIASGVKSFPNAVMVDEILYLYFYVPDKYPQSHISMIFSEDRGTTWLPDADGDGEPEAIDILFPGDPWAVGTQWDIWDTELIYPSVLCTQGGTDDLFEILLTGRARETNVPFTINDELWGLLSSANETDFVPTSKFDPFLNPDMGGLQNVLKHGNNYLIFYGMDDENGKKGIKLRTTLENWPPN